MKIEDLPKSYYRVSIKGLVLDETRQKFLIMREDNGYWELPGGGLDGKESIEECLRREVREEAGLEVVEMAKRPSYVMIGPNMKGNPSVNIVYEIKLRDLDFAPSNECQEIKFVTPAEAIKMNSWRNVKELATQLDPTNQALRHNS
jgi:8-oxo-dGTP diphosphatase